ncbi:hypothetical protein PQQ73_33440 [Paraburkholderia strydomiana]|uniref:Uncharacterized protein n=1 Tax=Paraburkholderia strydomiana TaxID=1245417 RepID=A0ABW9EQ37_9BURK
MKSPTFLDQLSLTTADKSQWRNSNDRKSMHQQQGAIASGPPRKASQFAQHLQ